MNSNIIFNSQCDDILEECFFMQIAVNFILFKFINAGHFFNGVPNVINFDIRKQKICLRTKL